nr:hypothetical protein [Rhodococcus sp. (in: high G+C Gram-positive bacteria)]
MAKNARAKRRAQKVMNEFPGVSANAALHYIQSNEAGHKMLHPKRFHNEALTKRTVK